MIHSDRMDILLGRYAVGDASCLTDPSLIAKAQDYRRRAASRMMPLDPGQLAKRLPPAEYHVSLKIDGELNVLAYVDGEAVLVNPGGALRAGLPLLDHVARQLHAAGVRQAVIAGELYYARPEGSRSRVHGVSRVARCPASQSELDGLHFAPFDLIELNGETWQQPFTSTWRALSELGIPTVRGHWLKDPADIRKAFDTWTGLGEEGVVLRSDAAGSYKVKPRHTIVVVVIGFAEGTDDRRGMIHDLLVALMRADGTFHILGRVGSGFSDDDRRAWLSDLQDLRVGSDYVEANDGVAYQMVWPRHIIEISVLDLVTQNTRGAPVTSMVLHWESAHRDEDTDHGVGTWRIVRHLPLSAMISPQFVRRRDDKQVNPTDLRLAQVTSLVDVQLAGTDAPQFALPASMVIRRDVWTKQLKGQTGVRKLVMWETNKAGDGSDFPAYVVHLTDYSPTRKTPLERDIRVSNSREQIEDLWAELVEENIVKGWINASRATIVSSDTSHPAGKDRAA
jgi:hypothetical protein